MNDNRMDFELFKSDICHKIKYKTDQEVIQFVLDNQMIERYLKKHWLPECLYCLALIDYMCRINNYKNIKKYEPLRQIKLPITLYPTSALYIKDDARRQEYINNAIPEFLRHNIVEGDIRNVC